MSQQTIQQELVLPKPGSTVFIFTSLGLALLFFLLLDISLGTINIPLTDVFTILLGGSNENIAFNTIVNEVRVPKALTAVLVGSALAISGLQMQTLFRNPLAGPSVFGITAGASFGVALLMLGTGGGTIGAYAIRELSLGGSWLVVLVSCMGSALVLTIIIAISLKVRDSVVLLIIGFLISNVIMAVISIWQYFSSPEALQEYIVWTFGSLSGVSNEQIQVLSIVVVLGLVFSFFTSKSLNLLLLGENYAASLGLDIKLAKIFILTSTSLLTGVITSFCGPIGLIGIAIPHLCRSLLNTSDHRLLIPGCCLLGAIVMLVCDVISQLPGYQTVLPINSVTSIIGAPVIIWIIVKRNNLKQAF